MKVIAWVTHINRGEEPPEKMVSVKPGEGIVPLVMTYEQATHLFQKRVLDALTPEPQEVKLVISWPTTQDS